MNPVKPEEFRCICDLDDLFEPPDPTPRAVAGCPARRVRYAFQQLIERTMLVERRTGEDA